MALLVAAARSAAGRAARPLSARRSGRAPRRASCATSRCTACGRPDFPAAAHCRFCLAYALELGGQRRPRDGVQLHDRLAAGDSGLRDALRARRRRPRRGLLDDDEPHRARHRRRGRSTMRVVVEFAALGGGLTLPYFRPLDRRPRDGEPELPLPTCGCWRSRPISPVRTRGSSLPMPEPTSSRWSRRPAIRCAARPPAGRRTIGDSALFQFLNTSKRSVSGRPTMPQVLALAAAADVVIVDAGVSAAAAGRFRGRAARRACRRR